MAGEYRRHLYQTTGHGLHLGICRSLVVAPWNFRWYAFCLGLNVLQRNIVGVLHMLGWSLS
jgi:hypothetical protein